MTASAGDRFIALLLVTLASCSANESGKQELTRLDPPAHSSPWAMPVSRKHLEAEMNRLITEQRELYGACPRNTPSINAHFRRVEGQGATITLIERELADPDAHN